MKKVFENVIDIKTGEPVEMEVTPAHFSMLQRIGIQAEKSAKHIRSILIGEHIDT